MYVIITLIKIAFEFTYSNGSFTFGSFAKTCGGMLSLLESAWDDKLIEQFKKIISVY